MQIINLTPHPVKILDNEGKLVIEYVSTGNVARIKESRENDGKLDMVPLNKKTFGDVDNLPAPSPNKVFIVSSQVVEYLRGERSDVVAPDDLVRDNNGYVIGCRALWYAQ